MVVLTCLANIFIGTSSPVPDGLLLCKPAKEGKINYSIIWRKYRCWHALMLWMTYCGWHIVGDRIFYCSFLYSSPSPSTASFFLIITIVRLVCDMELTEKKRIVIDWKKKRFVTELRKNCLEFMQTYLSHESSLLKMMYLWLQNQLS